MKIQAWENHEKAKTEAEMRKIEVLILFYHPISPPISLVFCGSLRNEWIDNEHLEMFLFSLRLARYFNYSSVT